MSEIKINNTEIVLRPSSLDGSMQCGFQWAKVFLEGVNTIPSARAAIGTGIHKGIEVMWEEAIAANSKDANLDMMHDAAIEAFKEETKKGMQYDDGENANTAEREIINGTNAWVDDLLPFLSIPEGVEKRFTIPISDHPIVSAVSGTVDYIGDGCVDDVKTSKKKPSVANYITQQSIYRMLAEANGYKVKHNRIQGVALLKSKVDCYLLDLEPNIDQAKYIVNSLLDKIRVAVADIAPIETIFSCNTKYYLCSPKYCSLHGSCPATRRNANAQEK